MYDPAKPYKHQILELIQSTWKTPYLSVKPGLYPTFTLKTTLPQVDHTDGLGTKGYFHWKKRSFKEAVIDAMAMNLNDLAMIRARAFKLQNHITLPYDDHKAILEIVSAFSQECKKRKIAMTGGETSIHEGSDAMDLSVSVSGIVEHLKPNKFRPGDTLLGFQSSGLHSNGFTKVKEIFGNRNRKWYHIPTAIYADEIFRLNKNIDIHGMMHITGGAFTKLKDILGNADIYIHRNHSLQPHYIFRELYKKKIIDHEMYRTFNCGIGFIISVSKYDVPKVKSIFKTDVIGEVKRGSGNISIESMFSNSKIFY